MLTETEHLAHGVNESITHGAEVLLLAICAPPPPPLRLPLSYLPNEAGRNEARRGM